MSQLHCLQRSEKSPICRTLLTTLEPTIRTFYREIPAMIKLICQLQATGESFIFTFISTLSVFS